MSTTDMNAANIPSEHQNCDVLYATLLENGAHYFTENRRPVLDKAYEWAQKFCENKKSDLGIPLLEHNLKTALLVTGEMGLGTTATLAVLLFDAYQAGDITDAEINQHFYPALLNLLQGLAEINKLDLHKVFTPEDAGETDENAKTSKRSKKFQRSEAEFLYEQSEYFIKLFITLSDDLRALLLCTAKQLFQMRHLKLVHEKWHPSHSRQAYYMFAPIAHRLGLYNVKTELEELAMKYMEPRMYKYIAGRLNETKQDRDAFIDDFITPIRNELIARNIHCEVKGRPKSIHSIWTKMKKQNVDFDGIYDLFAIRIIITNNFTDLRDEKAACWQVYSMITDEYEPNPRRMRDWISAPKNSGYESLHATVLSPQGKWVEVQIRTQRMDEIAEKGDAAHWKYKEVKSDNAHGQWLEKIREVLENPTPAHETDGLFQSENAETNNQLFIFTPKGELIKIHAGGTVLDFAFGIHSRLGEQCVGAKVNGRQVGIKEKLQNGDNVEIQTSKKQFPKKEWLNIVVSSKAKNRIKRYLKELENKHSKVGREIVEQKFTEMMARYPDVHLELSEKNLTILRDHLKFGSYIDFYNAVGSQQIGISDQMLYDVFIAPLRPDYKQVLEKLQGLQGKPETLKASDYLVLDEKLSGIEYELASCCKPIPGDSIFAFVTVSKGTKIHKTDCPNARDMVNRYAYRILKARWTAESSEQKFLAHIQLEGINATGVVSEISTAISKEARVNMHSIDIKATDGGMFSGEISVYVQGLGQLNNLLNLLRKINGVLNARRIEIHK